MYATCVLLSSLLSVNAVLFLRNPTDLNPLSFVLMLSKSSSCLTDLLPCEWLISCLLWEAIEPYAWVYVASFFSSFCSFPDGFTVMPWNQLINHSNAPKVVQRTLARMPAFISERIVLTIGSNLQVHVEIPTKIPEVKSIYASSSSSILLETNSHYKKNTSGAYSKVS